MNPQGQLFSIWLLPQQPTADFLNGIIEHLCKRYGTVGFSSHATLCSGLWTGAGSELIAVVDDIARQSSALTTGTIGIRYIESKFQFFYLGLSADGLIAAQQLALQRLPDSRLPEVGPHLSLMYSSDSSGIDRGQLSQELQPQVPAVVVFDRLALVLPRDNDWDDIAHWSIEHSVELGA